MYAMDCRSEIGSNALQVHVKIWIKIIVSSEYVRPKSKAQSKYLLILFMYVCRKCKRLSFPGRLLFAWGWGGGAGDQEGWEVGFEGCKQTFEGDGNVWNVDCSDDFTDVYIYTYLSTLTN